VDNLWAVIKEFVKRHPIYLLLLTFVIIIYLPFILRGGLIYDDWSVAKLSKDCPGIRQSVSCFWPGYPDRPLASIYYSLNSNLFRTWSTGYIFVVVAQWVVGISLLYKVFSRRFGKIFSTTFFLIAVTPSIASTVIFSPAMQGIGATSFLCWAFSFFFLDS